MKNTRKGFTGIELVIVIAIIAILAASLIPTFGGLFDSANKTADIQLAKNLNTALLLHNINGETEDFSDVLVAAKAEGYLISNLNPTSEGFYLVWEKSSNQFLLVDAKNSYEVLFAADPNYSTEKSDWHFITSNVEAATQLKADGYGVAMALKDSTGLADVIENATPGEQVVVYIDESFRVTPNEYTVFEKAGTNIVVDLAGSTVTADYIHSSSPYVVKDGSVSFENGTLVGSSSNETWDEACTLISGLGNAQVIIKDVEVSLEARPKMGRNVGILCKYGATMVVTDTVVYAANGNAIQCYGGTLTLNNVTVDQTGASEMGYYNAAIQVVNGYGENAQYNAKLTVNGGVYNGKIALQVSSPGGEVIINDGTFNGTSEAIHMDGGYADRIHSITINGGTFTGAIFVKDGTTLTINGGTFSVDPSTWVAEGHAATQNADGTWTVK